MTGLFEQKRTQKTGLAGLVFLRVLDLFSELPLYLVGDFEVLKFVCRNDCLETPYFYTSPTGNVINIHIVWTEYDRIILLTHYKSSFGPIQVDF